MKLVDDRNIKVSTAEDIAAVRRRLIKFIWPAGMPFASSKVEPRPVPDISVPFPTNPPKSKLIAAYELRLRMSSDLEGLAYYIVPEGANSSLVIVHQGHSSSFHEGRLDEVIGRLLTAHYSVLAVYMPHFRANDIMGQGLDKWPGEHGPMFANNSNPMHFFFDTLVYALNYVRDHHPDQVSYADYSMMGLSGGGWTTTVFAAIKPCIRRSFPVAGSIPLYLRVVKGNIGAEEKSGTLEINEQQFEPLYRIAGYLDLYVLGSYGRDREQVQILNEDDPCCFGVEGNGSVKNVVAEPLLREYESRVQKALRANGQFHLIGDRSKPAGHQVSDWTADLILKKLAKATGGASGPVDCSGTDR